jgi:hypothetical protein
MLEFCCILSGIGSSSLESLFFVILRSKEETVERRVAAVVRSEVLVACSIFEG